ncbi:hypothetical protein V6C27_11875, partial [Peptococcaceae bacterium 1198_IL3148]
VVAAASAATFISLTLSQLYVNWYFLLLFSLSMLLFPSASSAAEFHFITFASLLQATIFGK